MIKMSFSLFNTCYCIIEKNIQVKRKNLRPIVKASSFSLEQITNFSSFDYDPQNILSPYWFTLTGTNLQKI